MVVAFGRREEANFLMSNGCYCWCFGYLECVSGFVRKGTTPSDEQKEASGLFISLYIFIRSTYIQYIYTK